MSVLCTEVHGTGLCVKAPRTHHNPLQQWPRFSPTAAQKCVGAGDGGNCCHCKCHWQTATEAAAMTRRPRELASCHGFNRFSQLLTDTIIHCTPLINEPHKKQWRLPLRSPQRSSELSSQNQHSNLELCLPVDLHPAQALKIRVMLMCRQSNVDVSQNQKSDAFSLPTTTFQTSSPPV